MRLLTAGTVLMCGVVFMTGGARADEFGPRFSGRAPAALQPFPGPGSETENIAQDDDLAERLQTILPAAGDEIQTQADTPSQDENASSPVVSE